MHWSVVTPEYGTVIPILDDGTGPIEYGADYVCVEADTKRQALVAGVRKLRSTGSHWMEDQNSDGASPFTGLKAEKLLCPHGVCCFCDLDNCPIQYDTVVCQQCEDDWNRECEHKFYQPTDITCGNCGLTRGQIHDLSTTI